MRLVEIKWSRAKELGICNAGKEVVLDELGFTDERDVSITLQSIFELFPFHYGIWALRCVDEKDRDSVYQDILSCLSDDSADIIYNYPDMTWFEVCHILLKKIDWRISECRKFKSKLWTINYPEKSRVYACDTCKHSNSDNCLTFHLCEHDARHTIMEDGTRCNNFHYIED